jgi:hypothetical protein
MSYLLTKNVCDYSVKKIVIGLVRRFRGSTAQHTPDTRFVSGGYGPVLAQIAFPFSRFFRQDMTFERVVTA